MQRNRNYDIIRVVATILVICIHNLMPLRDAVDSGSLVLNNWICEFYYSIIRAGVPLFFMLSGALLLGKEENWLTFYRKRLKRILVPFILWSIVMYGLTLLIYPCGGWGVAVKDFFVLLFSKGVNDAYWFVYVLLAFYMITPLLRLILREITNYQLVLLIVIGCYVGVYYGSYLFPSFIPYRHWILYLLLYISGYICSRIICSIPSRIWIWSIVSLLILSTISAVVLQWSKIPWNLPYAIALFCLLLHLPTSSVSKDDFVTFFSRNVSVSALVKTYKCLIFSMLQIGCKIFPIFSGAGCFGVK